MTHTCHNSYLNVNLRVHYKIDFDFHTYTMSRVFVLETFYSAHCWLPLFIYLYFLDFRMSMSTNHQIIALKPLRQFAVRNEGQRKIKLPILFKNYKTLALMTADCHWK